MKLFICGLLLLISSTSAFASEKEGTMGDLALVIKDVKPSGVLTIEIDNFSRKPIGVWKEANSWGAAHWRVLLMRDGKLKTYFENPDQVFTRNGPAFEEIVAGSHLDRKLDIAGGDWRAPDSQNLEIKRGDVLVVIYDVPKPEIWARAPITVEVAKMGVWYGVATVSTTVK